MTWGIDWKWFQNNPTSLFWSSAPLMKKSPKIENVQNWSKIILLTNFDLRNRLGIVSGWSDFSFLIIGSLEEKESENRKCSKLVENHPLDQYSHDKSIGNGFRMTRLLFLDHRFPWWKRVRKSEMLQIGRTSSYKPIFTWGLDWKWFQNDPTSLSWSSVNVPFCLGRMILKLA